MQKRERICAVIQPRAKILPTCQALISGVTKDFYLHFLWKERATLLNLVHLIFEKTEILTIEISKTEQLKN